jgi:S1-C subfamily serine protease
VRRVAPEGPADMAGIQRGDRVTAIDGAPVHDLAAFYRALWGRGQPGIGVKLTLTRHGEPHDIELKTIDRYRYLKLDMTY